jgi:hypothetical protein
MPKAIQISEVYHVECVEDDDLGDGQEIVVDADEVCSRCGGAIGAPPAPVADEVMDE